MARRFCTLRNLVAYRGRFAFDAMGFACGGIYRTLLVSSIVTTSFCNEGHFLAGEQIGGTSDFFSGAFAFPGTALREWGARSIRLAHSGKPKLSLRTRPRPVGGWESGVAPTSINRVQWQERMSLPSPPGPTRL